MLLNHFMYLMTVVTIYNEVLNICTYCMQEIYESKLCMFAESNVANSDQLNSQNKRIKGDKNVNVHVHAKGLFC